MIDLNNLMDLLPYYFKEQDSYKVDGKGLLERFLNICGNYFQQYPLADLDNFLENLDVNKTNIIFVQNFWKFFGEMPFAQGPIIDPELFTKTFTGFNFDEAINKATRSTQPYTGKDTIDYRSIIKYSVSLFKIRGTRRFFDIMFRLYGLNVSITLPTDEDPFLSDHTTRFDTEDIIFDKATFDNYYRCANCSDVTFKITPPNTLTKQADVLSFSNQIRSFIERFVPFYINPVIEVNGWASLNKVKLEVSPDQGVLGMGETLNFTVQVSPVLTGNTFPSLAYQVAVVDTGETPTDSDWSQPLTDSTYQAVAGNKDYYFRTVADTTLQKKVHITEQYITTQYMIWVEEPKDAAGRILSKEKPSIELTIKAVEQRFTYRDGQLFGNVVENKPSIIWDNAPEGETNTFTGGTAKVQVKYYGNQIFSIASFRSKYIKVYIGVTDEYKKELDTITLSLTPQYLLIKDNQFYPGSKKGDELGPGVYGHNGDGIWEPCEYKTVFQVVNREGVAQPGASIVDVNNITKTYYPGDTFVPSTKGTSQFTFRASLGDLKSEPITLYITTENAVNVNPIYRQITVVPNPLQFVYSSGHQSKTLDGTLTASGISKATAQKITPAIVVKKTFQDGASTESEVYGTFKSYSNSGIAYYTFIYTHTIDSDKPHTLTFYPKDKPEVKSTVPVEILTSTTDVYLQAYDHKDQWTVNDTGATEDDLEYKRGKELTFTAKAGAGNNIAKFTFGGNYVGYISDGTNSYDAESDDPVSMEVKGNKDITFTAGDTTLTLHLRDFAGEVTIKCNPTTATLKENVTEVSTEVTGTTNKSEKFRFTIDGRETLYEAPYIFKTSQPGNHYFTAEDDPTQVANFNVQSDLPDVEVTKTELSWDANDTSEKSFEILIPAAIMVTITEEDDET